MFFFQTCICSQTAAHVYAIASSSARKLHPTAEYSYFTIALKMSQSVLLRHFLFKTKDVAAGRGLPHLPRAGPSLTRDPTELRPDAGVGLMRKNGGQQRLRAAAVAAALHWPFMSALSNLCAARASGYRKASCSAAKQSLSRTRCNNWTYFTATVMPF